jgi:tetratricopeptide (TPR) repeat protein
MERSLILFLNLFIVSFCNCQTTLQKSSRFDCSNKKFQDSLVERYIEKGAHALPYMYNDPRWIIYCDSVIALCPDIAYAYQQKAIPFIKNGEYEKAFLLYDKMIELEPAAYTAYRGFIKCIFTKDYEGAILDFQKAQQLTPNGYEMDHTYLFFQGLCNLELGNYTEAEKNLKQDIFIQTSGDISKNPHFNTSFYLGVLYYEMKNYSMAKEYLLKCISEYKEHTNANYYLALVYKSEKNYELEEKYLQASKLWFEQGYGISEDNVYYANYPHQIRLYEVEKAIGIKK